jgi:hypothetical protein
MGSSFSLPWNKVVVSFGVTSVAPIFYGSPALILELHGIEEAMFIPSFFVCQVRFLWDLHCAHLSLKNSESMFRAMNAPEHTI